MVEKALRWVVLVGVFTLPFIVFIVSQSLFFPFITGKNFTFRIIVESITGAWLALALVNPTYRPRRDWLLAAFAIFIIIVAIADATGVNPFKSFWSNYERMDGWVTLAHTFLYLVVASSVINTEKLWRTLFHVSLAGSLLMAAYSFLQLFGIISLTVGFSSVSRLDATFGNPIYLAVYMLFHVFIAVLLLFQSYARSPEGGRGLRAFYIACIVVDTVILFLTGTRGTMLGLIGGVFISAVLFAFFAESELVRKWSRYTIAGIVILAALFLGIRTQPLAQRIPVLNRLATISLSDSTTKARFLNWSMAWRGVQERPMLGWGQENYAIVFDKYYDPRMYGQEQWFDRVHDIIFDWLVAAGFVGLLSYLSIFAVALYFLWQKRRAPAFTNIEASVLTGLLAAYTFHNIFVFDNVSSYILFATILAYIVWRAGEKWQTGRIRFPQLPPPALPFVVAGAIMLVWGSAWFVNAGALSANRVLLQALGQQQGGLAKNLDYFKQAISYGSYGTQEVREQLAQAAAQMANSQQIPDDVKKQFAQMAADEMSLQAKASPLDARFPLFLGFLLDSYGDYADASQALEKAHELSPGKQTIIFEQANNALARGDNGGALQFYKEAYELLPDVLDARLYYAALAIRQSQDALADELLASVIPTGQAADPRIAAAYVARGRYDKIAHIWEARVKAQPQDMQAYFTLAAAYYGAGDHAKAISVLETAASTIPQTKAQAESLIQDIKNGTAKIQ